MDDVYLQTLQYVGKTVDEVKGNQQHLNQVVNERFETLERKVDALLNFFTDTSIEEWQRKELLRGHKRPNDYVAGEISPDSGHGATPSIEIPHTLTNGHLSEEDQVTSGHDVKCGSPRDMKETKARDTGRNSHIVQTFTTDAGQDTETAQTNIDENQFPSSVQETIVENPASAAIRETGGLRENGNVASPRSRTRSPSPLPSRPDRIEVPYSRFKKLKTKASEDNRTIYFANEMDIKHEPASRQDDGFAKAVPISSHQNIRPTSQPSDHQLLEPDTTAEDNIDTEVSRHVTDSERNSQQLPVKSDENDRQLSDTSDGINRHLSDISERTNWQLSGTTAENSRHLSNTTERNDRQLSDTIERNDRETSNTTERNNRQLSDTTQWNDRQLSDITERNDRETSNTTERNNRQLSDTTERDDRGTSKAIERNNRQLSDTGLKNEHDDDNRFVREAHLANDDFLNRIQRIEWKKNLEKFRSGTTETRSVFSETEKSRTPDKDTETEKNDMLQDSRNEGRQQSPDSTSRIQQILSQQQVEASANEDVKSADGLDTIICIDTSTSMKGEPLKKAKEIISDFIDGVENAAAEYDLEENVALVTFGKENRILQHLTNDYDLVRDALETIQAGGSSPLWLGLALSLTEISQRGSVLKLNSRSLAPRTILVTDGFATSVEDLAGQEKTESNKQVDYTITALIQMNSQVIQTISPVIVANVNNQKLLATMATMTNGILVQTASQVGLLHEYFRTQRTLDGVLKNYDGRKITLQAVQDHIRREAPSLSSVSSNEIINIIKKETSIIKDDADDFETDGPKGMSSSTVEVSGAQKLCFTLKSTWSRVRVTPNWSGDESRQRLVGTVISARRKGKVKVLWDDGLQETVRFGEDDIYDVHVVSEPKYLDRDEAIAIGIFVFRGPDWRWKNQDGGPGSVGVVTKVENGNVIHVVWPDGKLGNYRFGYSGKYDIQVCPNQTKPNRFVWEYRESTGGSWSMFPADFMEEIESLYQLDPTGKSDLKTTDSMYVLDLVSKKITDTNNADMPWNIRRKEVSEEEWKKVTSQQ